jgi:two-component system OmpR family response regulator
MPVLLPGVICENAAALRIASCCFPGGYRGVIKLPDQVGILVVEDDESIRRLVKMVLKREGYCVEMAGDGLEAVLKVGLADYDVIVLDLMMPNLDGFAFMAALEAIDPSWLKRVIVTSAVSPVLIAERLHGLPFDVLAKPFNIRDLAASVRACIAAQSG